jgi:hypothetical protein
MIEAFTTEHTEKMRCFIRDTGHRGTNDGSLPLRRAASVCSVVKAVSQPEKQQ